MQVLSTLNFRKYYQDLHHFHIIIVASETIFCTEFVDVTMIYVHVKYIPLCVVLRYSY
jgi:hypothetical protein